MQKKNLNFFKNTGWTAFPNRIQIKINLDLCDLKIQEFFLVSCYQSLKFCFLICIDYRFVQVSMMDCKMNLQL